MEKAMMRRIWGGWRVTNGAFDVACCV
jgi:hypothetical protein